ncbi:MAG: SAM-dependent methyltransferase [Bacteroidales bacterium]|jgi:16S rRNA (cytidine1402-2'-O)-methyltransferase|nr:SAM-dependent methyltransferase [Bacteroidales bacterium]
MKSRLHLIPAPLGGDDLRDVLPAPLFEVIGSLKLFFVEEFRTARRFLSKAGLKGKIDNLTLYELNEHTTREKIEGYARLLKEQDAGLISEAGLPAVADPGALLVELAHKYDIEVVPYVGPSSLMMALMASGMNGQCFAFTGYLPIKKQERRARIEQLEKISRQLHQTQIIIETPYRNDSLMEDLLTCCKETTTICIAADLTLPGQYIRTRTVADWNNSPIIIGKRPCVFVLQA